MLNLKARLKTISSVALEVNTTTTEEEVISIFHSKKDEYITTMAKERQAMTAKALLASIYILLNKETRTTALSTGITFLKGIFTSDNPLKSTFKTVINISDLLSSRALNDIDDLQSRSIMSDIISMVSKLTGYSTQEILNLKFTYAHIDSPCGVTCTLEKSEEKEYVKSADLLSYDKDSEVYKELVIPTLNNRLLLALSNWVQGTAPNPFELVIKDINTISADILPDMLKYQKDSKEAMETENITLPSLYTEDGNIKLNR